MADRQYADAPEVINQYPEDFQHHNSKYPAYDVTQPLSPHKAGFVDNTAPILNNNEKTNHDRTNRQTNRHTNAIPFGLSALTFGLLVALITSIVVGGAVGGGVGGALGSKTSSRYADTSSCTIYSQAN